MDKRIGLLIIDLSTNASNININNVSCRIKMEIPHVLQQHRAGDNATFIANQIFKNLELCWEQLDFSAATSYCSCDKVWRKVADTQYGFREDCGAAPSQSFHTGQQFRKRKWLDHVVVATS